MERLQVILFALLTVASSVVSFLFVMYGTGIVSSQGLPWWVLTLGAVMAVYGFFSFAALILAWFRYGDKVRHLTAYLAGGFLILYFLVLWEMERISSLELITLLIVAGMVVVNWVAVNAVSRLRPAT